MNKQIKTKLQFILGAILMVTFAVAGCNDTKTDKTTIKDSTSNPVPQQPVKDSMDSAHEAPTPDGN